MAEVSDVRSQSLPTEDAPHHLLSTDTFGNFPVNRIYFDRSKALAWNHAHCALSVRLARVPREKEQNRKRYTRISQYGNPSPKCGHRNLRNVRTFLGTNKRYKSMINTSSSKATGISRRKNRSHGKSSKGYTSLNLAPTVDLDKIDLIEQAGSNLYRSEKVPVIMFGPTKPRPQGPQPVKPRPR